MNRLSMTPNSPSSQLSRNVSTPFLQQTSQSDEFYSPPSSPVHKFTDFLLRHREESIIIDDSDHFTTPPQVSKYFKSNQTSLKSVKNSISERYQEIVEGDENNSDVEEKEVEVEEIKEKVRVEKEDSEVDETNYNQSKTISTKRTYQRRKNKNKIENIQPRTTRSQKTSSVGIESFKKFQYTCT